MRIQPLNYILDELERLERRFMYPGIRESNKLSSLFGFVLRQNHVTSGVEFSDLSSIDYMYTSNFHELPLALHTRRFPPISKLGSANRHHPDLLKVWYRILKDVSDLKNIRLLLILSGCMNVSMLHGYLHIRFFHSILIFDHI